MNAKEWGRFVVKCVPLIRAEAERLARAGVPLEVDDAGQDVALQMLEESGREDVANGARAWIRWRLLVLARNAGRKKRRAGSAPVSIDAISRAHDDPDGVPQQHVMSAERDPAVMSESHEGDVIGRVDGERLLNLWPEARDRHHARRVANEWLPAFQDFAKRGAA